MRKSHGTSQDQLRIFSIVAAAAFGALFVVTSLKAQSGAPPLPSPSKSTQQVYKNIQVLKDIPSDQLIPAMQFITSSLGVQCDFCHMEGSFDKDDKKPKQIARKMMQMMIIINQENFDSHRQVTCFTCHRGSPKPVAIPIISAEAVPPIPQGLDEEPPTNLPKAGEILDKYVQAIGGMNAIQSLRSRVESGKITIGPRQFPVDVLVASPDKIATVMHLPNGDNVTASNGEEGWTSGPGRPLREMSTSDVAFAKLDADLQFPAEAPKMFKQLQVEREEKVGGHMTYVLVGARDGQPPLRLYFDEQSSLLVRQVRYTDSPLGLNPTQIDYSDYRDQGGVKTAFQRVTSQPRGRSTIQIDHIEYNVPIEDSKFASPAAPAMAPPQR